MMGDGNRLWPSFRKPPTRKGGAFAAMAEVGDPVPWRISDFHEQVASPKSPLHAFILGDVRGIACYNNDESHYLLMRVRLQNEGVPIVWLRAETFHFHSGAIRFSADRSKLSRPGYDDIMVTRFLTLNFRHVIDLLNDVSLEGVPDSRWYFGIIVGMLHEGFNGSWVKPPPPDWLKPTLNRFIMYGVNTESVARQFAIQHPTGKKISFGDPERWKNEPTSLSQPPISKQVHPEGTHSNIAGTKEEIAHVASAPSEGHLQGPQPMQLPNVNGAVPAAATNAEKNGGDPPRGREINHSNILVSKPAESPTPYDPHRHPISRTWRPLSSQTNEKRPVQPANPSPTPAPPKEPSTGIDEAMSILQRAVVAAPSVEALGQGPQASPPFSNPQPNPPETPNLTGRIVRLGTTPMARGGYSSVWRGTLLSATSDDRHRTLQVALKVLHASYTDASTIKQKLRKHLHIEMRIWAQLHHENVVRLFGHTEEPDGPGLVSALYVHGDVLSFLVKSPSVNREIICADVALGLQYLHEHEPRIIHGDLKGRNVLIDGEGRASICDFGLSVILDGGPTGFTSSNFGGSLRFLAPELLDENIRTVETDIYAYACTCIEILFDQEPYHQLSKEAPLIRAISNHEPPFEPSNEEVTFLSILRILKRCWDHDRSRRPPLNSIIDTIKRCLYRTYRTNLGVHQGIRRRVRLMGLPGIEQAKLMWVDDDALSIVVKSSTSFHQVPIYQRYRWEFMDNQNLDDSGVGSDPSSSLSGEDASSSESPPYVSKWMDYSVRFRLPYSSTVSYECYHKASS